MGEDIDDFDDFSWFLRQIWQDIDDFDDFPLFFTQIWHDIHDFDDIPRFPINIYVFGVKPRNVMDVVQYLPDFCLKTMSCHRCRPVFA